MPTRLPASAVLSTGQPSVGRRLPASAFGPRGAAPKPKKGGGGVGGFLGNLAGDLRDAAVNLPAGAVEAGRALGKATVNTATFGQAGSDKDLKKLGRQVADTYAQTYGPLLRGDVDKFARNVFEHPLGPILDATAVATLGGSAVARGAAASRAVGAGGKLRALAKSPEPGPRTLRVGDLEVRGTFSRAPFARATQKAVDRGLAKAPVGSRREKVLLGRAAKFAERNRRVDEALARATGTRLRALGRKLKPEEQMALRLVAQEAPVKRRIAASELRAGRARNAKESAGHRERITLMEKAADFLDEGPGGKPMFKPEATKLRRVFEQLDRAASDREGKLKLLGLLDEESQQAAKTSAGRIALGARTVTPKEARLDVRAVREDIARGGGNPTDADFGALAAAERQSDNLVGAEDFTASPEAVFVGSPVKRSRLTGKPKVSSTGTFGHTQRPSSLRRATGTSVERAQERLDTTNVVAERQAETVRLTSIDRARKQLAKAGERAPRRNDDVFVWTTDDLISNERIPRPVRDYLDDPESIARPPAERHALVEQLKQSLFETQDWRDPKVVAEFEKLAEQGKGVFVPRRLLGSLGKRDFALGQVPGVGVADAINNAQKLALIYLKPSYLPVQALSNVAMNLIQQGFAFPRNLTRSARLSHNIGPELAAVVDDLMGQGAVLQANFEGASALSNLTGKVAGAMTRGVDTPARRAAFLHEAGRKGYRSPDRLRSLLEDDRHLDDLREIAQRAKEAIVDYDELSPFERSVVRRLVFVYPWQKGATKFAAQFLRDHPLQTAAFNTIADVGQEKAERELGERPTFLGGAFKAGGGLVNPAGFNFFDTPAQIGEAVGGLLTGDPATRAKGVQFLSPAPALSTALLTSRDDSGFPLEGGIGARLRDTLVSPVPAVGVARAELPQSSIARALLGERRPSRTFPNPNDALPRFFLGGLFPRQFNRAALNRLAARERAGR